MLIFVSFIIAIIITLIDELNLKRIRKKMKYKIGDKVQIRSDISRIRKADFGYMSGMNKFEGSYMTIEDAYMDGSNECYKLKEDSTKLSWGLNDFEPIDVFEPSNPIEFKVGDKVEIMEGQYGYLTGDIGVVQEIIYSNSIIVLVEGRTSTSSKKPCVSFMSSQLRYISSSQKKPKYQKLSGKFNLDYILKNRVAIQVKSSLEADRLARAYEYDSFTPAISRDFSYVWFNETSTGIKPSWQDEEEFYPVNNGYSNHIIDYDQVVFVDKKVVKEESKVGRYAKLIKKYSKFDLDNTYFKILREDDYNYTLDNFGISNKIDGYFNFDEYFMMMPKGWEPRKEVATDDREDKNQASLMAEAKSKFPLGTIILPATNVMLVQKTINDDNYHWWNGGYGPLSIFVGSNQGNTCIYNGTTKKWATVIGKKQDDSEYYYSLGRESRVIKEPISHSLIKKDTTYKIEVSTKSKNKVKKQLIIK